MDNKQFKINITIQLVIIAIIMAIGVKIGVESNLEKYEAQSNNTSQCNDIYVNYDNVTTLSGQLSTTELIDNTTGQINCKEDEVNVNSVCTEPETEKWSVDEVYMLAKIAMAEAEGCDMCTKVLVIESVLNRVDAKEFPDSIEAVLFEKHNGVYQYSTVAPGGRWYTTEPNDDCYQAVEMAKDDDYSSGGALYFESCSNTDNWHSRNLEYLYESDGLRFYK